MLRDWLLFLLGLLLSAAAVWFRIGPLFIVFFPLALSTLFLGNLVPYMDFRVARKNMASLSLLAFIFAIFSLPVLFSLLLRQTFPGLLAGGIASLLIAGLVPRLGLRNAFRVLTYLFALLILTASHDWVAVFNAFLVMGILSRAGEVFYCLGNLHRRKFRPRNWLARRLVGWLVTGRGRSKLALSMGDEPVTYEIAPVSGKRVLTALLALALLIFIIYYPVWVTASIPLYKLGSIQMQALGDTSTPDFAAKYGIPTNKDYVRTVSQDQVRSLGIRNKKSYDWSSWTDISDSDNIILNPQFANANGLQPNQMYWVLLYEPDTFYQKFFGSAPAYFIVNVNNPDDKKTIPLNVDITEEKYLDKNVQNLAWWIAPWYGNSDAVPVPTEEGKIVWVVPQYLDLNFIFIPWYMSWDGEVLLKHDGSAINRQYLYSVQEFKQLMQNEPWLEYARIFPEEYGKRLAYIFGMNRKGWWNRFPIGPHEGLLEIPELENPYFIQTGEKVQNLFMAMEPVGTGSRNLFGYFTINANGPEAGTVKFIGIPEDKVVYGPNAAESSLITSIRTETAYRSIIAQQAILYNINNALSYVVPVVSFSSEVGGEGYEYVFLKYIGIVDPEHADTRAMFVKVGADGEKTTDALEQALLQFSGAQITLPEGAEISQEKLLQILTRLGESHAVLSEIQKAVQSGDLGKARNLLKTLNIASKNLESAI